MRIKLPVWGMECPADLMMANRLFGLCARSRLVSIADRSGSTGIYMYAYIDLYACLSTELRGQRGLRVVRAVFDIVMLSRIGAKSLPFFCLPFLGRPALVVSRCVGSSACFPRGRLTVAMMVFWEQRLPPRRQVTRFDVWDRALYCYFWLLCFCICLCPWLSLCLGCRSSKGASVQTSLRMSRDRRPRNVLRDSSRSWARGGWHRRLRDLFVRFVSELVEAEGGGQVSPPELFD